VRKLRPTLEHVTPARYRSRLEDWFAHNRRVNARVGLTYRYEKKAEPYKEALRAAGLEPVDFIPGRSGAGLNGLSGLLLSGGSDIEPNFYGHSDQGSRSPDRERDEMELALAQEVLRSGMPVLAICRGMQLLNVRLGGTLVQDIGEGHTHVEHPVRIVEGSRLHSIFGPQATVNSRHHQALDRLGEGLVITATAPDGIVEGVERAGEPFVVGVQWHPEDLQAPRVLFESFADAVLHWKR